MFAQSPLIKISGSATYSAYYQMCAASETRERKVNVLTSSQVMLRTSFHLITCHILSLDCFHGITLDIFGDGIFV